MIAAIVQRLVGILPPDEAASLIESLHAQKVDKCISPLDDPEYDRRLSLTERHRASGRGLFAKASMQPQSDNEQ